jgi:O-antigen/teichoic acid export membrane protein
MTFITNDIELILWCYAISGLLLVLVVDSLSIFRQLIKDNQQMQIWGCLKHCAPLSVSLTAMSIQNNGVRFFLGLWAGNAMLGLFAVAYQIFTMPSMIFMAALNFYLKKSVKTAVNNHTSLIKYCFIGVFTILIGWLLLGKTFINIFFGDAFLVIYIPCSFLIACLIFKFIGYVYQWNMMNLGEYKRIAKHQVLLSILITFSSAICVYLYGLIGSYVALALSAFFYYCYFFILAKNQKL